MNEEINIKKQLKISLPIAFESLINILMTLIDTLVISIVRNNRISSTWCNERNNKYNANEYTDY